MAPDNPDSLAKLTLNFNAYALYGASFRDEHSRNNADIYVPVVAAVLSFAFFVIQGILWTFGSRAREGNASKRAVDGAKPGFLEALDGPVVFIYKVTHLVGVLALLSLSIYEVAGIDVEGGVGSRWILLVVVYTYCSLLAILSICTSSDVRDNAFYHLTFVLFTTLATNLVLYIWPLVRVDSGTQHASGMKWAEVALLLLVGCVIPSLKPATFRPAFPGEVSRPDQTPSFFSRITFTFVDKLVMLGYRMPDLKVDDLPELGHSDRASKLITEAESRVDPLLTGSRRHIFWTFVWFFRGHIALIVFWVIMNAVVQFISPFALKGLLGYMEGDTTLFKPWAWILLITSGPILSTITNNQFYVAQTHMTMQQESILTQLVFKHALRLRLDSHNSDKKEGDAKGKGKDADNTEATSSEESNQKKTDSSSSTTSTSSKDAPKEPSPEQAKKDSIIGRINNLVSSDMATITSAPMVLMVAGAFLQLGIAIVYLYGLLGWSAFVGLAVIIICIPLPTYLAKLNIHAEKKKAESKDKRVQTVTDTVGVMRMIKLFAWEPRVIKQILERRDEELKWSLRAQLIFVNLQNIQYAIPMLSYLGTAATYTVILKNSFPPSTAFASLRVFELVRNQIFFLGQFVPTGLRAKVSYDRMNEFLKTTAPLPDQPEKLPEDSGVSAPSPPGVIGFNAASFSWHNPDELDGTATPPQRVFRLRSEGPLEFERGGFNIIIGPTGSGKTSVLMALLGEMHYSPVGPSSWVSLPREGGVAYAAQESWVLNETIRDNIVFGYPYDEERYKKVLDQCGLERDLEIWEAGDQTEVGEKGLTLSGGQKARVTLARALYCPAQTLLLDDVLAALDVHTAKRVVDQAFKGDLVKGRTVILVTHNLALVSPIANRVVVLGKDGQISTQGSVAEVLKQDAALRQEIVQGQAQIEKAEEVVAEALDEDEKKKTGKLIVSEEKAIGHVSLKAIFLYVKGLGGFFTWFAMLSLTIVGNISGILETAWIGEWASQYDKHPASEVPALKYLIIYASIDIANMVFFTVAEMAYAVFSVRACGVIHAKLIGSIFGAPLRWLDTVPVGRIITRCTNDLAALDGPFAGLFSSLLNITLSLFIYYITTVFVVGWPALICGAITAGLGGLLGHVYLKAQLAVRREQSNAKSPVMSQIGVALQGLVSIRAYGAQSAFLAELQKRVDTVMRCTTCFYNLNRWIGIRSDLFGGIFSGVVSYYMVYHRNIGSAAVGFVLSIIVSFSSQILSWIRIFNWVEVQANGLERILDFISIEQESKPVDAFKPPAYWPASGRLRVEALSARYSDESPEVLKELTFEAKSGERIGVVGRTGAGKSSLALALLRAIKTSGQVYFDDRATDTVNLDALRASITLIPQQPELLPGTIRENLDPFGQHDDAALNDALRAAGLFDLQERIHGSDDEQTLNPDDGASTSTKVNDNEPNIKITLDSDVRGGGSNFSVGQRQIIALARAMLRRSKLLILDEATAGIDYDTDAVIQRFLRTELDKDTTVITIAHRLQTIMDSDKIMVLDGGKLVEFDSPKNLLQKEGGFFRSLVHESNDKEHLMQMAKS